MKQSARKPRAASFCRRRAESQAPAGKFRSRRPLDPGFHPRQAAAMFSHIVIFWTDPADPAATDELIAGAEQYLRPIPGVLHFHCGKMVPSHRDVVDQSYQAALNLVFSDQQSQDDYQVHPLHVEFVEKVFKRVCVKAVVYDFA
jgi:Stress responsive A/B Barrel Domain